MVLLPAPFKPTMEIFSLELILNDTSSNTCLSLLGDLNDTESNSIDSIFSNLRCPSVFISLISIKVIIGLTYSIALNKLPLEAIISFTAFEKFIAAAEVKVKLLIAN